MKPEEILQEALKVFEERGKTHGRYHASLRAVSLLWTAYLEAREVANYSPILSSRDVAHMMCLLKIARNLQNPGNDDNALDAAVYEAIAGAL